MKEKRLTEKQIRTIQKILNRVWETEDDFAFTDVEIREYNKLGLRITNSPIIGNLLVVSDFNSIGGNVILVQTKEEFTDGLIDLLKEREKCEQIAYQPESSGSKGEPYRAIICIDPVAKSLSIYFRSLVKFKQDKVRK